MSTFLFSPLRVVAGTAVGVGVGQSVADAISPITRELANEAWARYLSMPVSAVEAASLVASGERGRDWGLAEAQKNGIDSERFDALVDMWDGAPDLATLFDLYHRGFISEGDFREGAKKGMLEDKWVDALLRLAQKVLSPAEAAAAWQQGYMSEADASAEAALSGVNAQRSLVQRELAGLPPGPETALTMLRRGIITDAEFAQMIREGNTKTKYIDEYLSLQQQITSATTAAGLWLRGWLTEAQAKAIGAENGYGPEQMDHLYLNRGRPATTRQIHIGYARGGRLPGAADERAAFEMGVRQSNIRTEYTDVLWAQRHTYPSPFVLRALAAEGTFDRATTERILIESGWVPEYAALAAASWTKADSAGAGTKWADRARSRLFTAAYSDYLDGNADEPAARAMLTAVGVGNAEQDTIITLWNLERGRTRRDLTQAQILKLVKKSIWTTDQGQAALIDLGMEPADADALIRAG